MSGCDLCRKQCQEWAEDHTYLQNLCRKAGFSEEEVEGDTYGVPGIMDLADMLFSKCNGVGGRTDEGGSAK